jgi:hypothetical protein
MGRNTGSVCCAVSVANNLSGKRFTKRSKRMIAGHFTDIGGGLRYEATNSYRKSGTTSPVSVGGYNAVQIP